MYADRIKLAHIIYLFFRFVIESQKAKAEVVEEFGILFRGASMAAAATQLEDRAEGRSHEDVDCALFEAMLLAGGHCEDECALARSLRADVMQLADKIVSWSDLQRGEDPPNCDPGGGMRSPDYRFDDDQS